MKQIYVRPFEKRDVETFTEWATRVVDKHLLDMDVLTYPETAVLVAHDSTPLMYLPIQQTAMLESVVPRPNLTPLQSAEALQQLIKGAVLLLKARGGIHELYFVCQDPELEKFAKRHGFQEVPGVTLRLKLDKIENA